MSLGLDINKDGTIDKEDVKSLTLEQATIIYEEHYYREPKINLLPEAIQPVIFDMAVNHGPKRAARILQSVINQAGIAHIVEDGDIGKITARAADKVYQEMGHYFGTVKV